MGKKSKTLQKQSSTEDRSSGAKTYKDGGRRPQREGTHSVPGEGEADELVHRSFDTENIRNSGIISKNARTLKQERKYLTLIEASREGAQRIVNTILKKKGTDVNMMGEDDNTTPLLEACFFGHADVVESLLDHGALVDLKGKGVSNPALRVCSAGVSPLHYASGNPKVVKALLGAGADTSSTTKAGGSSLHWYCFLGRVEAASLLMARVGNRGINAVNAWGSTPLHLACHRNHAEVVKLLTKGNADPNCLNAFGRTPAFIAASAGTTHMKTVVALKAASADFSKSTKAGVAPIHAACASGSEEMVNYLLLDPRHSTFIELTTKDGRTPLHYASSCGHLEVVKLLLERGARCNVQSKDGRSPLHLAVAQSHLEVVEALLGAKGIRVNCRNKDHSTPLHTAAAQGHVEIAKALLLGGAGPSLSKKDSTSRTPRECSSNEGMENLLRECGNRFAIRRRVRRRPGHRGPPPRDSGDYRGNGSRRGNVRFRFGGRGRGRGSGNGRGDGPSVGCRPV